MSRCYAAASPHSGPRLAFAALRHLPSRQTCMKPPDLGVALKKPISGDATMTAISVNFLLFKENTMQISNDATEMIQMTSQPTFASGAAEQIIIPHSQPGLQTFRHSIDIYLKESNAYGNTYFARYFEWQGICRERWLHHCIAQDLLQNQGVLITKRAHQEFVQETFPFQTVQCELNTFDVKSCSLYLLFRFLVDGRPVSHGYQQIVFASHDKRIQRLPAHIIKAVQAFEMKSCDWVH
jgi:enediyne core biosynthesis thioesterase